MKNEYGNNHARERYRLRRTFYRDQFGKLVAEEGLAKIDPELVRQIDLAAQQMAAENEQLREALRRQKADFDNFRRRTLREKEQLRDAAKEALIATLLPVLDNFERAIESAKTAKDVESVRQGIEMVANQLMGLLEGEGLERVDLADKPFDPTLAEALSVEERTDVPDGQIVEVLRPAYKFKDRVIRPALVKVAKHPSETVPEKK
ncbi:MAG: nucleotide exchange factor GrpE [Candidatus Sumerlaeaceae bacterium]|nr:nucleotide exchange factor GrpE [Candidatus Sumerlaeaceae bacterium]